VAERRKWTHYLRALGPGLITGASDNDPAGISTYSVAGARTGYGFLWLSLVSLPLMIAVQDMAARIGAVRKEGLGAVIRDTFGRGWLITAVMVLIVSNIATMGADLAGIGAGLQLVTGVGAHWFVVPVALLIVAVEVFWSYHLFARYLRYLTLVLFAYVFAGFLANPDWGAVLLGTFVPNAALNKESIAVVVGLLGTTITPYMFFWQASEEVEELREEERRPPKDKDESEASERWRLMDTVAGMLYAVVIFYFIVLTSAATLHARGVEIKTAADAASALRPVAGEYAFLLFSIGIIGSGLIAIPVLAGSTAYPLVELLGRPEGLDKPVAQARWFYGILAAAVVVGTVIALLPINPIDALFYSQILTGLLTPVLLILMMLVARNKRIMGEENVNRPFFNIFGWLAVAIMTLADAALIWTLIA
jgi:NRAMP (natural resistance-associated macrophage protein)-like metal ion transporter